MEKKIISPELIQELANDIMLKIDDKEAVEIFNTEQSLRKKFEKVVKINTDNVEPMYYPFEINEVGLREDEVMWTNDQKEVLKNAPSTEGDYITIVKVVK
ncbi:Asp-tRNA(Asn)/Glu-tRNA(Gln) amidotransferase subunit GatC [Spiroplasma alleghenense]|uniref:Glutamyl-tRNA(Gln) amidotransferase subunit C n=1 Tax=Spiroplasma alleghenense TaxID=216931 RepID=A0A345Z2G5_9MOLU|nr:Asp-tRNA(Asn)/Glu-tRNA(Gln) amidotransferase subunit GatC [Spiroplasma alleghenense]AXK50794.1 glutamyl-tRNA(Gln) amidotransferase subunit C [Spiroplasma alleghenense]